MKLWMKDDDEKQPPKDKAGDKELEDDEPQVEPQDGSSGSGEPPVGGAGP